MKRMTAVVLTIFAVISIAVAGASNSNYFYIENSTGSAVVWITPEGNISAVGNISAGDSVFAENFRDLTDGIEWIKPEHISDVDDVDIETDVNTYWDIAGEEEDGSYHYNFTNSNLTIKYACFTDNCSTYIFNNGTNLIIQG